MKTRLLVVHGVGDPKPGEILEEVASVPDSLAGSSLKREDLLIDGVTYPRVHGTGNVAEIIEMNWSDVKVSRRTFAGVINHFMMLICSMLAVATERPMTPGKSGGQWRTLWSARVYRAFVETILVWVLLVPLMVMLLDAAATSTIEYEVTAAIVAVTVIVTVTLKAWSKLFWAGLGWAALFLALGLFWPGMSAAGHADMIVDSARVYAAAQFLLIPLLLWALVDLLFRASSLDFTQKFTYFGLLYIPFLILSGFGALAWAATLSGVKHATHSFNQPAFDDWATLFANSVHYDIRSVELGVTAAVGGIVLLAVLVAVVYLLKRRFERIPSRASVDSRATSGELARHGLALILFAAPIALTVAAVHFLISLLAGGTALSGDDLIRIYGVSVARLLPLLARLATPLAVVADIAGDVLFYVDRTPPRIKTELTRRMTALLDHALKDDGETKGDETEVVVFCDSQGTVIVRDALAARTTLPNRVVTVGSPIDTLYQRFLGREPDEPLPPVTWVNLYHPGDYVGGYIEKAKTNAFIQVRAGHGGYWTDPRVWEHLVPGLAEGALTPERAGQVAVLQQMRNRAGVRVPS